MNYAPIWIYRVTNEMGEVIHLSSVREQQHGNRAKVSVSLKRIARQNRTEILQSYPFIRFWLRDVELRHYTYLLQLQLSLRDALQNEIRAQGDSFEVVNQFNNEEKRFSTHSFITPARMKIELIQADLLSLGATRHSRFEAPKKAQELIAYMKRTSEVYSVALLGILFMLEENLCYAGSYVARALRDSLPQLQNHDFHFLNAYQNRRPRLWEFRHALDTITDFQTQANIVIAATITYDMHRELLHPRYFRKLANEYHKLRHPEPLPT